MKKFIIALLIAGLLATNGFAYGARGHRLVGAIADKRLALAGNEAVTKRLKALLDGMTLEEVATLPDNIKDWDPKKDDPENPQTPRPPFHVKGHPKIEEQLRAFVNANPVAEKPSHHEFHYTDVPVAGNEKYGTGKVGRGEFDIVHMIPFCIRVLQGQEPENNKRAITKTVAVILLAHYLGDIHQPLHVGAEYFDSKGKPFEPTKAKPGFGDQGGNKLMLSLLLNGQLTPYQYAQGKPGNLHSYWDGQTVTNAFGATPDIQTAATLAKSEPANWKLTAPLANWAELLANEIMPLAREAHTRLEFRNMKIEAGTSDIVSGEAAEKQITSGSAYDKWAADVVRDEIHKAGWRLAALLEEALK
jgi:hypothetical protein